MVRRTPPICRRVHDVVSFKIAVTSSCSVRHSVVQQVPAQKWRRVSGYSVAVARPEPFDQRSASPPQSGFQAIARQLVPAWAHGLASLCGLPMPLTHSRHTRFGGGSRPDRCIAAYSDPPGPSYSLRRLRLSSLCQRPGRLSDRFGCGWGALHQGGRGNAGSSRRLQLYNRRDLRTQSGRAPWPVWPTAQYKIPFYHRPTGSCSQPHCGACWRL